MVANLEKCSCDGKPVHAWAKKAPKPKGLSANASSSSGMVNQGMLKYECLVQIADKLAKYPGFIKDIHTVLFSSQYAIPDKTIADGVWKNDTYTTVSRIPREWMAGWLADRLGSKGLGRELLSSLEVKGKEHIPMLFECETQLPLTTSLPAPVRADEVLATKFFDAWATAVGPRLEPMLAAGHITKEKVSMKKASFQITWQGEGNKAVAKTITHIPSNTAAEVPPHLRISRDFVLKNNHLDGMASLEKAPTFQLVHGFFGAEVPFVKAIVAPKKKTKVLQELADKLTSDLDKHVEEQATAKATGSKKILDDASKKQRAAVTSAGREKMQAKIKARGLRRVVSYD